MNIEFCSFDWETLSPTIREDEPIVFDRLAAIIKFYYTLARIDPESLSFDHSLRGHWNEFNHYLFDDVAGLFMFVSQNDQILSINTLD